MNDWTRYSCQMSLPGFDEQEQQKLSSARVLVVGAGGLGCPALQYLVSSGVGTIGIADYDVVSIKNLHRQILYTPADEGKKKIIVAIERLSAQNPQVKFHAHDVQVNTDNVKELVSGYDIVLDCTDNFYTRYLLNDACVLTGKPLVYGAIYQYEGQVAVWNVRNEDGTLSPNYRDLYPEVNAAAVPNCADGGVIPTIAGIIGCMQANEVIKYITGIGDVLAGRLLVLNAQTLQSRIIKLGTTTRAIINTLPEPKQPREITADELKGNTAGYQLIDVRTSEEHSLYNIGGLHIPLQQLLLVDIPVDKPIVCYCASGKRSMEAAKILSGRYPGAKLYSLQGGLDAWPVEYQG